MGAPLWLATAGQQAATTAATGATGGLLGLAFGGINDRRQLRQQRRLNELEKGMTEYNMQKQLEMWEKTGYVGQKRQMKEAGINPALMYGMGGGGGQSVALQTGKGAAAPAGGGELTAMTGMGLQMGMMKAQLANLEADTEKKRAEAEATAGVQTDVGRQQIEESKARQQTIMQGLDNMREDYNVKRLQQAMMNMENYEKQASQADRLDYIAIQAKSAERSLQTLKNEGKISDLTITDKIKLIKEEAIGAVLKNALTGATTAATQQKINESIQTIMQNWDKMSQYNKEIMIKDELKSYNTDPVNDVIPEIADAIGDIIKGRAK